MTLNQLKQLPQVVLEHAIDYNQLQLDSYLMTNGHRDPARLKNVDAFNDFTGRSTPTHGCDESESVEEGN